MLAARALGRNEPSRHVPDVQVALLLEQFGPSVLGPEASIFDYMVMSRLLSIRDLYKVAGSKNQSVISERQWETIIELDALAAEETRRMEMLEKEEQGNSDA